MGAITNRMLTQTVSVNNATDSVLWGEEEDGALNGGTKFSATINNTNFLDLVVTIWIKSSFDSAFVANATTVTILQNSTDRIDVTDIVGYAARITAELIPAAPPTTGTVTISVQVQQ